MNPLPFVPMSLRSWLDNIKTNTRRVTNPQPSEFAWIEEGPSRGWLIGWDVATYGDQLQLGATQEYEGIKCPYGPPGTALWIREALVRGDDRHAYYRFDGAPVIVDGEHIPWRWKVRVIAQRYMPKEACRYVVWNKSVRAERLKSISFDDCLAEGVISWPGWGKDIDWEAVWSDPDRLIYKGEDHDGINQGWTDYVRGVFAEGWDSINQGRGHGWMDNPWVWVVEIPSYAEWKAAVDKGWHRRAA
jgi:hypothetical protein